MSISRRSFLKLAGLTTVAIAGVSLFAGCSVATHLRVELDERARAELTKGITDPEKLKEANETIDTYLTTLNTLLLAVPLPGVTSLDKELVLSIINQALDKAAASKPDDVAKIRKYMDKFDIVTDKDGKISAEGFFYGTITVKLTPKSTTATQELSAALAGTV